MLATSTRISSSSDDSEFQPVNNCNSSDNKNQSLVRIAIKNKLKYSNYKWSFIKIKISMLLRLQKAAYKEETSSGFFESSNSSNSSPKSNSPTCMSSHVTQQEFKESANLFVAMTNKAKIESAL